MPDERRRVSRDIHNEYTLRGERSGDITVKAGGTLWLQGRLEGMVTVCVGGRAHIRGTLMGDLLLDGGTANVSGHVTGQIITNESLSPA